MSSFHLGHKELRRIIKESRPKGVRKKTVPISRCYIDHREKMKPLGVRQDHMTHYIFKQKNNGLSYNKPCLCTSVFHASTKHQDCPLNPKYLLY